MTRCQALQQALGQAGLDALLLSSPVNRFYAGGFAFSAGWILILPQKAYLLTDFRYIEAARERCGQTFAVLEGTRRDAYGLPRLLKEHKVKRAGFEDRAMTVEQFSFWKKQLPAKLIAASSIPDRARQIKTQDEVAAIVGAQRVAEWALEQTLPFLKNNHTEKQIAAELTYRMLSNGASAIAFPPIVASGPNGALPHAEPGDRIVQDGDFVVLDFGCVFNGYCSDMTRTVAVGGVADEMKRVYHIVLQAQMAGIAAAQGGIAGKDIDAAARSVIENAGFGKQFGHGFGHGIGLEVHEGIPASKDTEQCLPAGSVISAEPGIYLPGRFGVRIEDMLLLTENGCQNLTNAPKELMIL